MDNSSTTTTDLDQTDDNILTYTVSDEALEAAAGTERRGSHIGTCIPTLPCCHHIPPAKRHPRL
jgi:hypothetical protein